MQMRQSPASPFVRKVTITAHLKGVADRIEYIKPDSIDDTHPLASANPLSKIPTLLLNDGTALYDSPVICEYLDSLVAEPKLFPTGVARWQALTRAALGDGILEAALLLVYEGRYRPAEMKVQTWIDMQERKIAAAIQSLDAAPPAFKATPDIGHITVACALGYLDFRHGGQWRSNAPALVGWLEDFATAVPAFDETTPTD